MRSIRRYSIAIDRDTFDDNFPLAAFAEVMQQETKATGDYERIRGQQLERLKTKKDGEKNATNDASAADKEKADEPKATEPKVEEPKAEEPAADKPAAEEVKPEEPAAEPGSDS